MYKEARKRAGLSIEEASFQLHIAPRTLCKYEAGETTPPPEVVLNMGEVYNEPRLTARHCRYKCAIGHRYCYEILDNVDLSPIAILTKFAEEKKEVDQLLGRLLSTVLNKRSRDDLTGDEAKELENDTLELLDLEHVIETMKFALWDFLDIAGLIRKHNDKCIQRGYIKTKKPLAKAAI